MKAITLLIFTLLFLTGCPSTTVIISRPGGAKVSMDNKQALGKTPIQLKEQVWVWTKHDLLFTKKGYHSARYLLEPQIRPLNVALCGMCFMVLWPVWPLAFLGEYKQKYVIRLRRKRSVSLSPKPKKTLLENHTFHLSPTP